MTEGQKNGGGVQYLRRIVAFAGLMTILLSQFLIFSKPVEDVVFPPYTWLAILGLVVFFGSWFIRPSQFFEKISTWFVFRNSAFWVLVAFVLSSLVTFAVVKLTSFTRINYIPAVTLWLLSAWAYGYAFWDKQGDAQAVFAWFRQNRQELLAVAGVTLLGTVLRLYKLGDLPKVLDGDEGLIGIFAQTTTGGDLMNPFSMWENFGSMYLQLINIAFNFFGVNPFALRLLPAIGGILAIPSVYLLARWLGGRRIAIMTAALLAFSHTHINFSRIVSVAYIHGTWLAPLELYFFISGMEKRETWRTALGGILLGIHFSVYLTAQVIAGLIFVYLILSALFYRGWLKARVSQAAAFWGGLLLLIMPTTFFIFTNPNEFFNRLGANGTFQTGWLQDRMLITGHSAVQILFERFVHAFMSLIYYPALDFYGATTPVISMITSVLFIVGLTVSLMRIKRPAYLLLNGYFWGATFSVGVFAIPPSADSYRMLMAIPAAFIMAAIGLDKILESMGLDWKSARNAYIFSASAVLFSLMVFNMWTYFGEFAGKCRFGNDSIGRFASYLGSYTRTVDNEFDVYLLSDPLYFYGSHASTDFLSLRRRIVNVPDPIDTIGLVSGETVIASPERFDELVQWTHLHPGGDLTYQYDCDNLLLVAYRVP
ncbi:MAG: glycosyltransferase family 39 protein [Anaerolineales bacterium]|nr:glycosyltransferase family 39 protein [Anaerolineales bacterium]